MIKVSDILKKMVKNDQQLEFFLSNKLLNLTQFGKFVKPLIDTQMQKNVQLSAIVMALSRLQQKKYLKKARPRFSIRQLKLYTDLCTMSFDKNPRIHQEIQKLYNEAMNANVYFMISESSSEITLISKTEFIETKSIPRPKFKHMELSAISIQFDSKYLSSPGVITSILQKLTLQNINFVEITSTNTEISIFVDRTDVRLAFDTLYDSYYVNENDLR